MKVTELLRKRERDPRADKLLSAGIALSVIKVSLDMSMIIPYSDMADNAVVALICLCYSACILMQGNSFKTLAAFGGALVVAVFSAFQSGEMVVIFTMLACIAMKDCDFDRVLREIAMVQLVFLTLHTLCALCIYLSSGAPNVITTYDGVRQRSMLSLGFIHKNMFGLYILNLALLWVWFRFESFRFWDIAGLLVLAWVEMVPVYCRTAGLTLVLCCALLLMVRFIGKERLAALASWLAMGVTPALAAFTMVTAKLWEAKHPFGLLMDDILTRRMLLAARHMKFAGFTMFGHSIKGLKYQYPDLWGMSMLDNVYSYLLLNIGWIWLIALSVGMFLLARRKNVRVNFFVGVWALYGMSEIHVMNGFSVFPILMLSLLLSEGSGKDALADDRK